MWGYKKMKAKYLVASMLGIVILSLAVYSTLHSVNDIIITNVDDEVKTRGNGFGQSMGIVLVIEHERDGELISRMVKDDDLAIRNLAGLFHLLIKGSDAEISHYYVEAGGAERDFTATTDFDRDGALIRIGTGTTAADYMDYSLETAVMTGELIEAIGYSVSGLEMNATIVSTFNIDNTYAITEAALDCADWVGFSQALVLFRDVFSPINVISGDIITVKYILMFN